MDAATDRPSGLRLSTVVAELVINPAPPVNRPGSLDHARQLVQAREEAIRHWTATHLVSDHHREDRWEQYKKNVGGE